jgi:hypothetical protein
MRESDEPNNLNQPNPSSEPRPAPEDDPALSAELQSFERAWSRLAPRAAQLDRDQLFYQAGWSAAQAAAQQGRARLPTLAWPAALAGMTAGMTVGAAALLAMLLVRPAPRIVDRVVYVPTATEPNSSTAARAFASSDAGASAAESGDQNIWTVGQFLRRRDAGTASPAGERLPLDAILDAFPAARGTKTPADATPVADPIILSSRSFDLLLEEGSARSTGANHPDCQTLHTEESSHDL